jgi:hypothetical protein
MERFEFDSKTGPNNNRKNGITRRGVIEVMETEAYTNGYREHPEKGVLLEIHGPAGAYRGAAMMDKATAGKLGAALLKWAGAEFVGEKEKRLLYMVQFFLGNLSLTVDETMQAMNQTNTGEAAEAIL